MEEARRRVEREGLAELLAGPRRSRVIGDRDMPNVTASVLEHHESVQQLKRGCGDDEEVHRRRGGEVIPQEGAPGLRGRRLRARTFGHQRGDGGLSDDEAELEQLAVNARRTPARVVGGEFHHDANGNVEGVTQTKLTATGVVQETTTRSYDVLDRLETETRYDTKQTTYRYDAKGNRTRVADFQGVDTTYTFDAQDKLQTAVTAEGTTTYGYFPDGLAKTTAFFNGTYEGRCYDDAGRLTALVTARAAVTNACAPGAFVSRQQYTHDAEGANSKDRAERRSRSTRRTAT